MMKTLPALLILCLAAMLAFGQNRDEDNIRRTVATLFTGMRTADTALIKSAFAGNMILQSVALKKDGSTVLITESPADFIRQIAAPHNEIYDEQINITAVKVDGPLAVVWAPYKFYLGKQFSHCGVNVFQLMKVAGSWKIISIVDTRRKDNCPE